MVRTIDYTARFDQVLAWRRRQTGLRAALTVSTFLYLLTCATLVEALAWAAVYTAFQIAELAAWSRFETNGRTATPAARRFGLFALAANSAAFGSMCWLALSQAHAWTFGGAAFGLAGCVLHGVMTTRGSPRAYAAVMAPYVIYAAGMPAMAFQLGLPTPAIVNLAYASGMTLLLSAMMWKASGRMMAAEEAALALAREERGRAEVATAAKTAFVSTVSHELRTPMSAILAGAAALEARADGPSRGHAALISDAGGMMRKLLDDLLDLSKIEAGKLDVETIPFEARALVVRTLSFWRAQARDKGVRLRLEGARYLPERLTGDPTRLRQILNNLLSNALKFTDEGSVTLRVTPATDGDLGFEVLDTGSGMTPEQLSRLFRPFDQGSADRARTHGGTGLGLSISRDLARLMGGDLTAASVAGKGSAFSLALPLRPVEAASGATLMRADGPHAGLRILVVDDHAINRRALSLILEAIGAEPICVDGGHEALRLAAGERFDVVLMDVNMQGLSGLETVRLLREGDTPNRATPVVAVTGSVEARDVVACLAAGMDRVVAKPVLPAELIAALGAVLAPPAPDPPGSSADPETVRAA